MQARIDERCPPTVVDFVQILEVEGEEGLDAGFVVLLDGLEEGVCPLEFIGLPFLPKGGEDIEPGDEVEAGEQDGLDEVLGEKLEPGDVVLGEGPQLGPLGVGHVPFLVEAQALGVLGEVFRDLGLPEAVGGHVADPGDHLVAAGQGVLVELVHPLVEPGLLVAAHLVVELAVDLSEVGQLRDGLPVSRDGLGLILGRDVSDQSHDVLPLLPRAYFPFSQTHFHYPRVLQVLEVLLPDFLLLLEVQAHRLDLPLVLVDLVDQRGQLAPLLGRALLERRVPLSQRLALGLRRLTADHGGHRQSPRNHADVPPEHLLIGLPPHQIALFLYRTRGAHPMVVFRLFPPVPILPIAQVRPKAPLHFCSFVVHLEQLPNLLDFLLLTLRLLLALHQRVVQRELSFALEFKLLPLHFKHMDCVDGVTSVFKGLFSDNISGNPVDEEISQVLFIICQIVSVFVRSQLREDVLRVAGVNRHFVEHNVPGSVPFLAIHVLSSVTLETSRE